jgi:hypothetical protein
MQNKFLLKSSVMLSIAALSVSVNALEKPQTMEDMWKIIQAQQKQIDEMTANMKATPDKTGVAATGDVKNLERKTNVLSQEVEKLRTNLVIPEEAKYKSAYGLGPAASKVYQVGKGLSIGGYGDRSETSCQSLWRAIPEGYKKSHSDSAF